MDAARTVGTPGSQTPTSPPAHRPRIARTLTVIEFLVGTAAVAAGALMLIRPDGSLLAAGPTVLTPAPFDDWTVPGVLLAVLVGGGFLVTCAAEWSGRPIASAPSVAAGSGLIAFEIVQLALIGWHPLQPIMMITGAGLVLLVNLRVAGNSSTRVNQPRRGAQRL